MCVCSWYAYAKSGTLFSPRAGRPAVVVVLVPLLLGDFVGVLDRSGVVDVDDMDDIRLPLLADSFDDNSNNSLLRPPVPITSP